MEVKVTRFDDELMHYGIKGMKWGVRRYQNADGSLTKAGKKRADKQKAKLDARDLEYFRKTVHGYDLSSSYAKKLAGKQIAARGKLWTDYWIASNGGKIDNEETRALRKKFDENDLDMANALLSDVRVPSGRTPRWIATKEDGKRTLIFE